MRRVLWRVVRRRQLLFETLGQVHVNGPSEVYHRKLTDRPFNGPLCANVIDDGSSNDFNGRSRRFHRRKWFLPLAKGKGSFENLFKARKDGLYTSLINKAEKTMSDNNLQESLNEKKRHIEENVLNQKQVLEDAINLRRKLLQDAFRERKEKLRTTEKKISEQSKIIMRDLRETKEKMKGRMEDIVEKENIYTIPNLLCVTRIIFSPYLGYLIVTENYNYALTFMVVAGISDWADGWVARNFKSQSTKIGSFLDPMADKIMIGTLFLTLTYTGLIPVQLTALIVARDVVLVLAGFVIRYRSLPPPRTLSRYFDASHATAQLAPTFISKVNTGIQLALVGTTLAAPVFGFVGHPALQILCYITATTTIISAGSYMFSSNTYRYLRPKD